jgi:hypothetical protein
MSLNIETDKRTSLPPPESVEDLKFDGLFGFFWSSYFMDCAS